MSYFTCPNCSELHRIFGPSSSFYAATSQAGAKVLGELPLVPSVSAGSDAGAPITLRALEPAQSQNVQAIFERIASTIYSELFDGNT